MKDRNEKGARMKSLSSHTSLARTHGRRHDAELV